MKKKICIVCTVQFSYEKFIREISRDLYKQGFDITAVFNWDNPKVKPKQEGVIFKNISLKRTSSPIDILIKFMVFIFMKICLFLKDTSIFLLKFF